MRTAAALVCTALVCCAALAGCGSPEVPSTEPGREYVKDMIGTPAYASFTANPAMRDGKTLQAPPPGSIARGYTPFEYAATPADALRAGAELKAPVATAKDVARGDQVFHNVCATCHGNEGKGDGPVIPRFPQPPSLLGQHAKDLPDGQIFHIIARGQGLMPAHAQVLPADRWRVIAYVRKLQKGTP